MDYGAGVEHCGNCHRPRCRSCGSCAQISRGSGGRKETRRRYICTGCGARSILVYPPGEDGRRYAAQDAAFGIGRCDGCGTRTDHKRDGVICCVACSKARDRGYRDRDEEMRAKYGAWDEVVGPGAS
jgi:hypothetical protein